MNALLQMISEAPSVTFGLVKVTALLAFVWALHGCTKKLNPRWNCLLWRSAILGLVVVGVFSALPALVQLDIEKPASTIDVTEEYEGLAASVPTTVLSPLSSVQPTDALLAVSPRPQIEIESQSSVSSLAVPSSIEPTENSPHATSLSWPFISWPFMLLMVWLAGSGILVIRLLCGLLLSARVIKESESGPKWLQSQCDEVASRFQLRRTPQVLLSSRVHSPSLVGMTFVGRAKVVLPLQFGLEENRSQLLKTQAVLAHELAHCRRRDPDWNLLMQFVAAVLWFHPLAWRIQAAHMTVCENVCDDMAVEVTGNAASYQQTLAQVALARHQGSVSVGLTMARSSEIMSRLKRLDQHPAWRALSNKHVVASVVSALMLALVTGSFGFQMVEQSIEANTQEESNTAALVGDAKQASVTFSNAGGQRIQGASASVYYKVDSKTFVEEVAVTNDSEVAFRLNPDATVMMLVIRAAGHVPYCIERNNRRSPLSVPSDLHVTLQSGHSVKGVVHDEDGDAIAGADVAISMRAQDADRKENNLVFNVTKVKTNQDGEWSYDCAPFDFRVAMLIADVSHPDFLPATSSCPSNAEEEAECEAVMSRGVEFRGYVVGPDDLQISGASVTLGSQMTTETKTSTTDLGGEFLLSGCRKGDNYLIVSAEGYAPQMIDIAVVEQKKDASLPKAKVVLSRGVELRGRVIDRAGNAVADATVMVDEWRGRRLALDKRMKTDKEGYFVWKNAPEKELAINVFKDGYQTENSLPISPNSMNPAITLGLIPTAKVNVVDAETGKPLPDVWVSYGHKLVESQRLVRWATGPRAMLGKFEYQFKDRRAQHFLRVGKSGYGSVVREFSPDMVSVAWDVKLKPFKNEQEIAWEPIRVGLEEGRFSMELGDVVESLRDLGASLEWQPNKPNQWTVRLADKFQINSAMHGVGILTEDVSQRTWRGNFDDFWKLADLPNVDLKLEGFMLNDELLAALARLENLSALEFDNCPLDLTDDDCGGFAKLRNLQSLNLEGRWQALPEKLVESIADLPNLKELRCDGGFRVATSVWGKHLPRMSSLRTLSLDSFEGLDSSIGSALVDLKQLKSLTVNGKKIDDSVADQIAGLPLRRLDLSGTGLTDRGLKKIADSLPELEFLDIIKTKITRDGLRSISSQLLNLERLEIDEMERDALVEFQLRHPDCAIYLQRYIRNGVTRTGKFRLTEDEKAKGR